VGGALDRRGFLLLGGGVLLSACSSAPSAAPPHHRSTSAAPAHPKSQAPKVRLPTVSRWPPDRGDLDPAAKVAAVREIERHGNRPNARLEVIDAQYGGLLGDRASVLVVSRLWRLRPDGRLHAGGHTFDVRVSRAGPGWHVTAIHPSRPGPPVGHLPSVAHRVLADPRIALPPASEADVRSGRVHTSVLTAMLELAGTYRIGVSVVRSGHPKYVFGTHRLSDHPQGRAFDTWRINDRMVVDPATPRPLVTGYMHAAAAAGSYNVGGPYLLGAAPQFFSDQTHHDHVHAGFAG
jgi:hypothetical protein